MITPKPQFYECGCCTQLHNITFTGDCRQDDARFNPEDLDQLYGQDGWEEIELNQ